MSEGVRVSAKKPEAAKEERTSQTRKFNYSQPANSLVDRILFLQRTIGNQAVGRLIKSGALQAKLRIGQPDDIYEQEADRVAEQVMRMPEPQILSTDNFHIQRACPKCERNELKRQPIKEEEEEKLQRQPIEEEDDEKLRRQPMEDEEEKLQAKTALGFNPEVDPGIENHIQSMKSGGNPLSESERAFFEPRFGHDFSKVRVHSGAAAEQSAREVNANAYTVGHNIVFGKGGFAPGTHEGQRLIAHELTHVVQQSGHQGTLIPIFAYIQRQRRMLGTCRPVQDDLRPTASWGTLQAGYRARCGSAINRILGGRAPNPREAVDCVCAYNDPLTAAYAALVRVRAAGPLAAIMYLHFLGHSGAEMNIDVADMIARSRLVRAKILRSIKRSRGKVGTTRIEQRDLKDDEDLQFAYGAIDCVQWKVARSTPRGWRSRPNTPIEVSMLDYYEFHPARKGVSQCAHAACVELVYRGQARNFWTSGQANITLRDLRP